MDWRHPRPTSILAATAAALLVSALGAGPSDAASPSPPSGGILLAADGRAPAAAPLSAGQLAKIEKFIAEKHRDAVIDAEVAKLLGLGTDGKRVVAEQVSLVDKDKKTRHLFDRLKDGSGFLVGKRSTDGMAVYRLGNDLTWVASVLWRKDGNKVALRSTDATAGLRQELELWARFADQQK
jgi:hypothetical protein